MPDRNRTDRLGLPPRPSLATPRESLNKAASVLKWRRWEVQKEHGEEGNQLRYVSMFYNDLLAGKSWKILEIGVSRRFGNDVWSWVLNVNVCGLGHKPKERPDVPRR